MDATEEATARVLTRYEQFLDMINRDWPIWLAAAGIIVFAFVLAAVVGRLKFSPRKSGNPFVASLIHGASRAIILLVGFVIALDLLNATAVLGSLLGAAGVVGIAVGFAVRDVLENYLAGLFLSLRHPFTTGDLVRIDGEEGTVLRLTPRSTLLLGLDGNHIRIPNATVFKTVIINYTREPKRRFSFTVGVDVSTDLVATRDLVMKTLYDMDGILKDPAVMCNVQELGDSNVVLFIAGWMNQSTHDYFRIRSEGIRVVKEALDGAAIGMPEPIINIRMMGGTVSTAPAEAAPAAAPPKPPPRPAQEVQANTERLRVAEEAADDEPGNLLDQSAPKE